MATKDPNHSCFFELEENARGYLTGNFICVGCGRRLFQSQWAETIRPGEHVSRPHPEHPKSGSS
jgi:hypothetical protein